MKTYKLMSFEKLDVIDVYDTALNPIIFLWIDLYTSFIHLTDHYLFFTYIVAKYITMVLYMC
jgi:hypothetical protein